MTVTKLKRALPLLFAAQLFAADPVTHVKSANPKVDGMPVENVLSPELLEAVVAQGSMLLENPSGKYKYYGYNDTGAFLPAAAGSKTEANKTEPDKNTYLVLTGQKGADPLYNYGTHFLFQGHETGIGSYITRVNLDADAAHRVTLMASSDVNGVALPPAMDGSTWYPFSQRLLFTIEAGTGGVYQATLDVPSKVEEMSGIFGKAAYEGIQSDDKGRLILEEDASGSAGAVNTLAKRPNSFVYRFVPDDPTDLKKGGKLQVLQVTSRAHSGPISYSLYSTADLAILSQDAVDLHTYGQAFRTTWVTIHDTRLDGTTSFDANALAKAKDGTPFKRPENGQFRPGSNFSEYIFDETGDTNLNTQAGTKYGGFGAIFRLVMDPSGDSGTLFLVYNGDSVHAGFDNCAFWDADHIVFVEDAGDTLHAQRNALDSAWMIDVRADYSSASAQPVRVLAQGRDASATMDSLFLNVAAFTGTFPNEGDNEITGWHQSDGDPTAKGLLGAKVPTPYQNGWRLFYTQQHGDNRTFEVFLKSMILSAPAN